MNIAEVERRTGLTRANIRFYEKEGLVAPARSANGYRDYTEADVETLRKVRLLRQLRLSVADIRAVQAGERPLPEAAAKQLDVLEQDIREGQQAYAACRAICASPCCRPMPWLRPASRTASRLRDARGGGISRGRSTCRCTA